MCFANFSSREARRVRRFDQRSDSKSSRWVVRRRSFDQPARRKLSLRLSVLMLRVPAGVRLGARKYSLWPTSPAGVTDGPQPGLGRACGDAALRATFEPWLHTWLGEAQRLESPRASRVHVGARHQQSRYCSSAPFRDVCRDDHRAWYMTRQVNRQRDRRRQAALAQCPHPSTVRRNPCSSGGGLLGLDCSPPRARIPRQSFSTLLTDRVERQHSGQFVVLTPIPQPGNALRSFGSSRAPALSRVRTNTTLRPLRRRGRGRLAWHPCASRAPCGGAC